MASGDNLEIIRPLRLGDVITCNQKLADLRERKTEKATRVYITFENTFTNQNGEVVAKGQASYVRY
jgi:acyl dehydratase